jgi:glutathione synthase/RimK-type ligase-like ATP-grasp enzyme
MKKIDQDKTCSACGTSPVNHQLLFIGDIIEETAGRLSDKIFFFTKGNFWRQIATEIEKSLFTIASMIFLVRFDTDIEKALTGRSKLIWEEAQRRGIEMKQLVILGKHVELYRAKINGKNIYFQSLPIPSRFKQTGYLWLDDKFKLYEKLTFAGIPAPRAKKIITLKSAITAFNELTKPVIIKPRNGSRARHTTTNIKTEEELKRALSLVRQITLFSVIQEHLFGSVYRATVINGKLVGFFRGNPPQITGDGKKNIQQLIEDKNANRPERLSETIIGEDLITFIKRQGYTLSSILNNGITINLSGKTGRMYGGYTEEMLPKVHPKMHEIFKKAGLVVEAPVVGFDLITEDPTKDPDLQRWGIIECNSLPFIDLHYFAFEGEPINLAKNIWDLWLLK